MKNKVYGKVRSYLDDGLYVLLITAFHGEEGKMDGDLKKIMHAKSNDCEYRLPVKFIGDDLITTYEPMAPPASSENLITTGLDLNVIDSICDEEEEIIVVTIIDALVESHQGVKLYMRRDGSTKGLPEREPIPDHIMERIALEAKQLFGTNEYRFLIIPTDETNETGYSILLEDVE